MKNNVSIDDLRYFLAVLEEGGFRAAAKRLGVAPSHVSTTVTRIESDLGVPLLLRSTRSVRATEEGLRFAAKLRPHLADINAAVSELSNSAGQVRGRLKPEYVPHVYGSEPYFTHSNDPFEVDPLSVRAALEILEGASDVPEKPQVPGHALEEARLADAFGW